MQTVVNYSSIPAPLTAQLNLIFCLKGKSYLKILDHKECVVKSIDKMENILYNIENLKWEHLEGQFPQNVILVTRVNHPVSQLSGC
jgi:hypothetical protein